jgi:hypothetical protein
MPAVVPRPSDDDSASRSASNATDEGSQILLLYCAADQARRKLDQIRRAELEIEQRA